MLGHVGTRGRSVLAGIIAVTLVTAAVYVGVRAANGAFEPAYYVTASFDAAGQGLISKSDVKIHGVNIGEVTSVKLRNGRADVRMKIREKERIPTAATATIRPKTLFGEKFVDIDPKQFETSGPFLADGGRINDTVGGFELERILGDLYPVLQAVDGDDVATVLGELSASGKGMGETVNRSIANFTAVADVQARHADDTQQFLDDLALLSEELAARSGDLVAAADDLNVALPPINQRADQVATVLDQAARLSADVADILEANRSFTDKAITKGGLTIQHLYDQRGQIPGLVRGLRMFLQVLAEVGRIDLGDGTKLAAVKDIVGGGSACGRTTVGCTTYSGPAAGQAAPTPGQGAAPPASGIVPGVVPGTPVPLPLAPAQNGSEGLTGLIQGLLR